ncbi:SHOCT domain-containing protein [Rhodococcus sp. D2-41]|uniref:SHOCT domain-containing protein n=1 Tax=Speluncibacter jeojiensis TaxID=2710754 RepID=A0A9X4M1T0_9ACTN|nr:SHOCT domain-containing protein [Rhodococcus sp. D2-41]MDG3009494.1 SHOCT domain-containing protein [Rhodococcus sp. D2-41]MDG3016423.1 SHOCT domain-containing protein [Corynebacteriales bacterium D3-21]
MVFRPGPFARPFARPFVRPGLLGTVARSAVVAGTAAATVNAVNRRSQRRAAEQQAYEARQQETTYEPEPAASNSDADEMIAKLKELGQLHESGVLSDDEFAAAKAKLLG